MSTFDRDLHDAVIAYVRDPATARFEDLAVAVFAAQFAGVAAYRRVCERRGRTPETVVDWREVPPVPTLAFKRVGLCTAPPERTFLTTGTTQGAEQRGRHEMPDLRLYQAAAVAGLRSCLFPDVGAMRILSLVWSSAERPESSLAQMTDWAIERFGNPGSRGFVNDGRFDFEALAEALRTSERDGEPTCLLTTTGALLHFLDHCRDHDVAFRLPHGSRVMDTGGTKGAPRTMSRNGLLRAIWETFAIPGYFVVNEYGMTELSSQFYDNVVRDRVAGRFGSRLKVGPHWVRTRALDPTALTEVPAGEVGLLCHFDLANAGSAACVLTEDLGRMVADGFEIVGRASGAETRGCSLAAAELAP